MSDTITLAALPSPLRWQETPVEWSSDGATLHATAGAVTDLFIDPQGSAPKLNAPRLVTPLTGDFLLSARVTVDFRADFDAGVLLVYAGERTWAKLCFEYSPQRLPMVVSVVTRGVSDDANGFTFESRSIWLRVARLGGAFAFHASTDGAYWHMIRHFAIDSSATVDAGFLVQSPTGEGCAVAFDAIAYTPARLAALRTGV
jgi:hypothetical protein